ncbi:MAG: PKD domain-containing protein [bacterium]|nr:PKD domain-containing protein [bacterium]
MRNFFSLVFVIFLVFFLVFFGFQASAAQNKPPLANADGPYQGIAGTVITFNGSGSSDPDGDPLSYSWDFGDGNSGSGVYSSHTYTSRGNFTATLTVNDGTDFDSSVSSVRIFLPPPLPPTSPVYPADGEKLKKLNEDLSLTIKWEEVADAKAYRYQYWKEGSGDLMEGWIYQNTDGTLDEGFFIPYGNLEFGQHYFWHVKSCADLNGNGTIEESVDFNRDGIVDSECGNYSNPSWSLTYISTSPISPPVLPDPADNQTPGAVQIDWPDMENASSFIINAKINVPGSCNWYKYIWGFFGGGNCDPFKLLADKLNDWFTSLLLGFGGTCSNYDPSCPWLLWDSSPDTCKCVPIPIVRKEGQIRTESNYMDDACIFSKGETYKVRVASCRDSLATDCGPFSNEQKFEVGNNLNINAPRATSTEKANLYSPGPPETIPTLGRRHYLQWEAHNCSNYVRFILKNDSGSEIIREEMPNIEFFPLNHDKFNKIFDNANDLDRKYSWQLQSCWKIGENIICDEGKIGSPWYFKTVGAAPQLLKPALGGQTRIPMYLEWQAIDGAESYRYQVAANESFSVIKKEGVLTKASLKIDYPDVTSNSQYWWRVKTCVDAEGSVCGNTWSEKRNFSTYPLNPPTGLEPLNGPLPAFFKWNPDLGANFYQYKVDYISTIYAKPTGESSSETLEGCAGKVGTSIYSPTINSQPSMSLYVNCLGQYKWWVRSCLDKDCSVAAPADWASAPNQVFTAFELPTVEERGIVPCGRSSDNLKTPYNEREPCQLKHLGFTIQNILDFLLWRLGLIVLGIFSIMTGAIAYFSLGGPGTLERIKSIWKSAGIGYLIMILSWTFINLILSIAGFQVQFFGRWFQLPF